jgi:thioesterase domain-containing protein
LLPLRRNGTLEPIFFVHPIGGLSWVYAKLLPYLPEQRPVYALQARTAGTNGSRPESLHELAVEYIDRIRAVTPHGPWSLIGWSSGGVIAQEMAVILKESGEDIAHLVVLDAMPVTAESSLLDPIPFIKRAMGAAGAGLSKAETNALVDTAIHHVKLFKGHATRRFDGRMVSLEATGSRVIRQQAEVDWNGLSTEGAEIHEIEGHHATFLEPAVVRRIGPILFNVFTRRREEA